MKASKFMGRKPRKMKKSIKKMTVFQAMKFMIWKSDVRNILNRCRPKQPTFVMAENLPIAAIIEEGNERIISASGKFYVSDFIPFTLPVGSRQVLTNKEMDKLLNDLKPPSRYRMILFPNPIT